MVLAQGLLLVESMQHSWAYSNCKMDKGNVVYSMEPIVDMASIVAIVVDPDHDPRR